MLWVSLTDDSPAPLNTATSDHWKRTQTLVALCTNKTYEIKTSRLAFFSLYVHSTDWLTDRSINWQIDRQTDRQTEWLTDWPTGWRNVSDCLIWPPNWHVCLSELGRTDSLAHWLIDWLTSCLFVCCVVLCVKFLSSFFPSIHFILDIFLLTHSHSPHEFPYLCLTYELLLGFHKVLKRLKERKEV